jgi:very-short-patch-repair endonuclease
MWKTKIHKTTPQMRNFARSLRKTPTAAELILWRSLRCKRMCGVRFHRQKAILDYVVDFYCPKALLAIEVDGAFHNNRQTKDAMRDARLKSRGILTLRFTNFEVYEKIGYVQAAIHETVTQRCATKSTATAGKSSAERKSATPHARTEHTQCSRSITTPEHWD